MGDAHFQAIVAPTQSGIRIHGDSGVRITLDVDESFMAEALKLVMWRDGVLDVYVRPSAGKEQQKRRELHI